MSWEKISPDLSLNDRSRQGASGGNITRESAGAEIHATCASVVESPHRKGEIWASTDDGLVHVTRDGGKNGKNVTPKALPELAYVGCVEISPHDPDTIYVAATRYKLADYRPHVFKSSNGGRSWTGDQGRPAGERDHARPVDPTAKGLLYVGTETGGLVHNRRRRTLDAHDPARRWSRSTTSRSRTPTWSRRRMAGRSGSWMT